MQVSGNTFVSCSVTTSSGSFGGAVSVYYGFSDGVNLAFSISTNRVSVQFEGNACQLCTASLTSTAQFGNVYGGCLSVYTGPFFSVTLASITIGGSIVANSPSVSVQRNMFSNCSARSTDGCNSYGGAVSVYYGTYVIATTTSDSVMAISGPTQVSNAAHVIANNVATNCSAVIGSPTASLSGSNAYGACADPRCFDS